MPEIPLPDPPLRDGEVALRPPTADDLEAVVEYCQDPEIGRWTAIPSPYSRDDARHWLASIEPDRRAGKALALLTVSARDGRLLGSCGLVHLDWQNLSAEAGYVVAAWARRRGVGTRALLLLSRWTLSQLGMERVEVLVHPDNEPSRRLALAAGFTEEGLLRSYRERKGRREDYVVLSLIRTDL
jgi:RimJ/RimL family protein N-acetyltransferase